MMEAKLIAAGGIILTGLLTAAGRALFNSGKRAGIAAAKARLEQLHEEQLAAAKTAGTADDERVAAKIAAAKTALAALEAL